MTVVRSPSDNLNIVTDYLERNPDFFLDNPHLLSKLNIPHLSGNNVTSLIEYQVSLLKQNEQLLRNKFAELENNQQQSMQLARKIQEQALRLLNTTEIEQLFDSLFNFLRHEYQTSHLLVFAFVEQRPCHDYKGLRFKKTNSKLRFLFTELFTRNKPLCDSLQSEYLEGLFENQAEQITSTVALPMQYDDKLALMVLGSRERNAYKQGFSINLLNHLKDIFIYQFRDIIHSNDEAKLES